MFTLIELALAVVTLLVIFSVIRYLGMDLLFFDIFGKKTPTMAATSVTGVGYPKQTPPQRKGVMVLIVDDEEIAYYGEDFRKADYVITKDGKVLKTRDGSDPPVVIRGSKKKKYRTIDES
jgi:hypothetical protein